MEPGGGFYVLDELFSEKKPQADDGGGIRGDGRFVFCRYFVVDVVSPVFLAEWRWNFRNSKRCAFTSYTTHICTFCKI